MPRASGLERLHRLDLITARLKAGDQLVLGDIARELGVSLRTITRDIEVLREQGVPVEAERGRGGGVRLDWRWQVGRLSLSYAEAVDLLISIAIAERMNSPLLLASLEPVRRKVIASFAPALRSKVDAVRERILIGAMASAQVMSGLGVADARSAEALNAGFLTMHRLKVHYRAEGGAETVREIEPHYLLLNFPVWYVVGWDHLRGAQRTFRCDRFVDVQNAGQPFRLQPLSAFEEAMSGVEARRP